MKCQFIYVTDLYLFQKILDMAVDTIVSLWNLKTKISSKPIAFHDKASWHQELPILQVLEEGNDVWQNEIRLWSKVDSSVLLIGWENLNRLLNISEPKFSPMK